MPDNSPIDIPDPSVQPDKGPKRPTERPGDILRQHLEATDPVRTSSRLRRKLIGLYDRPPSRVDGHVIVVFILALIGFLAGLGYFVYGLMGGMLDNPYYIHVLSHADRARILSNLALVDHVAVVSGIIAVICYVFLLYHEEIAGYVLLAAALIIFLALPAGLIELLPSRHETASAATAIALDGLRWLALIPAIPGIILIAMDLFVRLYFGIDEARMRAIAQRKARKHLIRRKRGPYLLLGPCWRQARGTLSQRCLWDEIPGRSAQATRALEKVMQRMDGAGSYDPFTASGPTPGERPLTREQKRQVCRQCRHFNAHQNQKYIVCAWAIAIGIVAVLVLGHDILIGMITGAFDSAQSSVSHLAFAPSMGYASPAGNPMTSSEMPDPIAWVILLVASLIVVAKSLQLLEYCFFRLKI